MSALQGQQALTQPRGRAESGGGGEEGVPRELLGPCYKSAGEGERVSRREERGADLSTSTSLATIVLTSARRANRLIATRERLYSPLKTSPYEPTGAHERSQSTFDGWCAVTAETARWPTPELPLDWHGPRFNCPSPHLGHPLPPFSESIRRLKLGVSVAGLLPRSEQRGE